MVKRLFIFLVVSTFFFSCEMFIPDFSKENPNVILFFVDDLGYGELGVYGQRIIQTRNIDALANNGVLFTQFYSGSPVCAPSRSVLLTGMHSGHTYIRGNHEWGERGDVWSYEKMTEDSNLEGQYPIKKSTITLSKVLSEGGYKTGMVGKWGLGGPNSTSVPTTMGFDYFYGYNCQRIAHNLYPPHLWENENKVLLDNELVSPRTKLDEGADPYDDSSYDLFFQNDYAPDLMHQKALEFINENKNDPFFLYYASPLPHAPLQVPKPLIEKYKNLIGKEEPYLGDNGYFPHRNPKAAYAAMIEYIDIQVGEIIQKLKDEGIYENTIIMFTSDNGPTYAGGVDANYFNSTGIFQNDKSRMKGYTYEGGIRVPFIVSWPEKIKNNRVENEISASYDLFPTICDMIKIPYPKTLDGISLKSTILNEGNQNHHEYLYWEFPAYNGQQAIRLGKWKAIRNNIFKGNKSIELYDLEKDLKETNDLSDSNPTIIKKVEEIFLKEHVKSEIDRFRLGYIDEE